MTLDNYDLRYYRTPFHKKKLSHAAYKHWSRRARLLRPASNPFEWVRRAAVGVFHLLVSKIIKKGKTYV